MADTGTLTGTIVDTAGVVLANTAVVFRLVARNGVKVESNDRLVARPPETAYSDENGDVEITLLRNDKMVPDTTYWLVTCKEAGLSKGVLLDADTIDFMEAEDVSGSDPDLDVPLPTLKALSFITAEAEARLGGSYTLTAGDGVEIVLDADANTATVSSTLEGITTIAALRAALVDAVSGDTIDLGAAEFSITGTSLSSELGGGVTDVKLNLHPRTVLLYQSNEATLRERIDEVIELAAEDTDLFIGMERRIENFGGQATTLNAAEPSAEALERNVLAFYAAQSSADYWGLFTTSGSVFSGAAITFNQHGRYWFNYPLYVSSRMSLDVKNPAQTVLWWASGFAPSAGVEVGTFSGDDISVAGCVITNNSAIVTCTSTSGLIAGMAISGVNVPASAWIKSINSATQFTMNAVATGVSPSPAAPATLTANAVDVANNTIAIENHRLANAQRCRFYTTSGALPAGITANTDIYARIGDLTSSSEGNRISFHTRSDFHDSSYLNLTNTGSGTHTIKAMERFALVYDKTAGGANSSNENFHAVMRGMHIGFVTDNTNHNFSGINYRSAQQSGIEDCSIVYCERGFVATDITTSLVWKNGQLSRYSAAGVQGGPTSGDGKAAMLLAYCGGCVFIDVFFGFVYNSALDLDDDGEVRATLEIVQSSYLTFEHSPFEATTSAIKLNDSYANRFATIQCNPGRDVVGSYGILQQGQCFNNVFERIYVAGMEYAMRDESTSRVTPHIIPCGLGNAIQFGWYGDRTQVRQSTAMEAAIVGKRVSLTGCETVLGDATVTCISTADIQTGMMVTGTGVPLSTYVSSITNSTTFELTQNATASNAGLTLVAGNTFEIYRDGTSLGVGAAGIRFGGEAYDSIELVPATASGYVYLCSTKGVGMVLGSNGGVNSVAFTCDASNRVAINGGAGSVNAATFTGTAAVATTVTVATAGSDSTMSVLLATDPTGNLGPKTTSFLGFDSTKGATLFGDALALGFDIACTQTTNPRANVPWLRVGGGDNDSPILNAGKNTGYVYIAYDKGAGAVIGNGATGFITYLTVPATGTLKVTTDGTTLGTILAKLSPDCDLSGLPTSDPLSNGKPFLHRDDATGPYVLMVSSGAP